MTLRCACVTTLPSVYNIACLGPLTLAREGQHYASNIITCEIVNVRAKFKRMPWRNPEKPTRSFKDCRDERRWWDRSAYKLPFRKFKGLDETALWGPLYQRFNTTPMPILDMEAWHADVVELMRKSATVKELYKHMEERKKKRFDELVTAINDMDGGVEWFCQPRSEDVKSLGMSLFHLWRDPSLFETARVFQTMTEIKEQARQECRRGQYKLSRQFPQANFLCQQKTEHGESSIGRRGKKEG